MESEERQPEETEEPKTSGEPDDPYDDPDYTGDAPAGDVKGG
jgi:hypothetical protein